jgi:hypothetical protein
MLDIPPVCGTLRPNNYFERLFMAPKPFQPKINPHMSEGLRASTTVMAEQLLLLAATGPLTGPPTWDGDWSKPQVPILEAARNQLVRLSYAERPTKHTLTITAKGVAFLKNLPEPLTVESVAQAINLFPNRAKSPTERTNP